MIIVVRLLQIILCICFLLGAAAPRPSNIKVKTVVASRHARQTAAANARIAADLAIETRNAEESRREFKDQTTKRHHNTAFSIAMQAVPFAPVLREARRTAN